MKRINFLLIPLVAFALLSFGATPAHAINLPFKDLWESVKCVTDIDCTVQAAGWAAGNFIVHNIVGKDFEMTSTADIGKMVRGEWDQGLASAVGEIGALAYTFPPIHVGDYVRSEFADNILNNPVEAQDTAGEKALNPIQEIWSKMRDIAYGLFAVVMVAIGFMIMLRKEISPRVVITFTSALPKVLLGLILITFSYPIMALIIDIGAVFFSQVVLQIMKGLFSSGTILKGGLAFAVSAVASIFAGALFGGIVGAGVASFTGLGLFVIFGVAVIVLAGMALFRAIMAYGWLIVYTVFSPLLFLFGTLPGQEGSIVNLFKKVFAKTLVFPLVLFFMLLGLSLATTEFVKAGESLLEGNLGGYFSGVFTGQSLLGVILGMLMLAAAFKAPALIEETLGTGVKKKK